MFLRGSLSWSIARQVTISAWVEIEAARHADDRLFRAARHQALRQALDLDVVGLVAIVAQLGGIRWHVGEALDGALERHPAARRLEHEVDLAEAPDLVALDHGAIGEAVVAQPLLADAAEIDVGA